jgi:aspartate dehydrogenase
MKKIGLAGFGLIGRHLFDRFALRKDIEVAAVWDADPKKTADLSPALVCPGPEDLGSRLNLDLIVEAAHPDAVKRLWPCMVSGADLMVASMTSLADPKFRTRVQEEASASGRRVFLPHGAVLGLDGLRHGRNLLTSVSITTTKHPRNLGMDPDGILEPDTLFDGSTREACRIFPRNVNVHAAVALAGMGFEATRSIIVADPHTSHMRHRIQVRGQGLEWNLEIESRSTGQVTGSYTPESLHSSVLEILLEQKGLCLV